MSVWDKILPHRFLINRALRNASDELRNHIDLYRIEHELAIQRCHNELEAAKAEKNRQFELLKQEYLNELAQDSRALGELQSLFLGYVDKYTKRKLLYLIKEKMTLELQLINEYGSFLNEQKCLVSEEIIILEQRQKALTSQVKIDDIVTLIKMSGYSLPCDNIDTPKALLEKVNLILFECNDLSPQTKAALYRLRSLLQERAEYMSLIQYISWLIQQKKNFCREISRERREMNEAKNLLKSQISATKLDIEQLNEAMLNQAVSLRNIWAVPLADIAIEFATVKKTLDQMYSQQKQISAEIKEMKSERSNDSDRWERLQAEGKAIYEAIGRLNNDKVKLREQQQQWFKRKNIVFDLFKKNDIFLMFPKGEKIPDEVRVLKSRRLELCDKINDINRRREDDTTPILNERYQQEIIISSQICTAEKMVTKKKLRLAEAKNQVEKLKAQDDRSFIARFFSESKDVIKAKIHQDEATKELEQAEQSLSALRSKLKTINTVCEQRITNVNRQYNHEKIKLQESIESIDLAITFIQKKKRR